MSRKTNKTNHVLNLLASGVKAASQAEPESSEKPSQAEQPAQTPTGQTAEQMQASAGQTAEPVQSSAGQTAEPVQSSAGQTAQPVQSSAGQTAQPVQPSGVSVVRKSDGGVADQIRDTLEKEFRAAVKEELEEEQARKTREEQKKKTQKKKETAVSEKKEPSPEKPSEAPAEKQEEEEDDFITVNVMERLVREKVPQYISQFRVCGCRRCLADVTALALTELPAKYVVINRSAVSPLMNFYSTKYAGRITVEVTKACMAVQKNPHHK